MSDSLTPGMRSGIAEPLGDAEPAAATLLISLAQSVEDHRQGEHPAHDVVLYLGRRMAPVLRRLLDAEAELELLRAKAAEPESVPALAWAEQLDGADLHDFLGEVAAASIGYYHHTPEEQDRETLDEIQAACERWRGKEKDTRAAGESTPTRRRQRLGEFIGCANPRCNLGEWSAKADERGWEHWRGGGWLCPRCAVGQAEALAAYAEPIPDDAAARPAGEGR
jgi:hypothetical protein